MEKKRGKNRPYTRENLQKYEILLGRVEQTQGRRSREICCSNTLAVWFQFHIWFSLQEILQHNLLHLAYKTGRRSEQCQNRFDLILFLNTWESLDH